MGIDIYMPEQFRLAGIEGFLPQLTQRLSGESG